MEGQPRRARLPVRRSPGARRSFARPAPSAPGLRERVRRGATRKAGGTQGSPALHQFARHRHAGSLATGTGAGRRRRPSGGPAAPAVAAVPRAWPAASTLPRPRARGGASSQAATSSRMRAASRRRDRSCVRRDRRARRAATARRCAPGRARSAGTASPGRGSRRSTGCAGRVAASAPPPGRAPCRAAPGRRARSPRRRSRSTAACRSRSPSS